MMSFVAVKISKWVC